MPAAAPSRSILRMSDARSSIWDAGPFNFAPGAVFIDFVEENVRTPEDTMKRPTRHQAWLERRGYSIHTKKRIGSGRSVADASADVAAADTGNVVPFPARSTLRGAATDCPQVSVPALPTRIARTPR